MNTSELLNAVHGKGSSIGRAFELMGVAEEEIARAKVGLRDKAERARVHNTFRVLAPGVLLRLDETVYRHHCREMIGRMRREEDTRPATRAEVLAHLSRLSLEAPPGPQWAALQEDLFAIIFERRPSGRPIPEPFPHASAELLATLRNTFRVPDRRTA